VSYRHRAPAAAALALHDQVAIVVVVVARVVVVVVPPPRRGEELKPRDPAAAVAAADVHLGEKLLVGVRVRRARGGGGHVPARDAMCRARAQSGENLSRISDLRSRVRPMTRIRCV